MRDSCIIIIDRFRIVSDRGCVNHRSIWESFDIEQVKSAVNTTPV